MSIARASAIMIVTLVASRVLGWLRLSGFPAWAAWCLVHIFFLIGFRNRILVMFEWAWAYLTRQRGVRLITGDERKAGTRRRPAR